MSFRRKSPAFLPLFAALLAAPSASAQCAPPVSTTAPYQPQVLQTGCWQGSVGWIDPAYGIDDSQVGTATATISQQADGNYVLTYTATWSDGIITVTDGSPVQTNSGPFTETNTLILTANGPISSTPSLFVPPSGGWSFTFQSTNPSARLQTMTIWQSLYQNIDSLQDPANFDDRCSGLGCFLSFSRTITPATGFCTYSLAASPGDGVISATPSTMSFEIFGGHGTVSVTATPPSGQPASSCAWLAVSAPPVSVFPTSATGSSGVAISIPPIPAGTAAQSVQLVIAGQTFTVYQANLSPQQANVEDITNSNDTVTQADWNAAKQQANSNGNLNGFASFYQKWMAYLANKKQKYGPTLQNATNTVGPADTTLWSNTAAAVNNHIATIETALCGDPAYANDPACQPPAQPQSQSNGVETFSSPVPSATPAINADPAIEPSVIGFEYRSGPGNPNFKSVFVPPIGGTNEYQILVQNNGAWVTDGTALALAEYTFTAPIGVPAFRVMGIPVSAGLTPDAHSSWVAGVAFESGGSFTGTITALTSTPVGAYQSGVGIYRSSNGLWLENSAFNNVFTPADTVTLFAGAGLMPQPTDIPVGGDWSGTGTTKIGLFRPSTGTWYLDYNGNGIYDGPMIDRQYQYGGIAGDIPIVGDWTGSGFSKIGVFRSGFLFLLNTTGSGSFSPSDQVFAFGGVTGCTGALPSFYSTEPAGSCDIPIVGDWNQSGTTKVGIVRAAPGTSQPFLWILDTSGAQRYIPPGTGVTNASTVFAFGGILGDVPVAGHWNGSLSTQVGVFRDGFFWVEDTTANLPTPPAATDILVAFPYGGIPGDEPVVGHW
jgi:hypothetical protein